MIKKEKWIFQDGFTESCCSGKKAKELRMKNYMPRVVGICLLLGIVFSLSPARAATYTDVGKNHWAYTYIQYLSEKDVLAGDGNGRFRPDATVTRAELSR